jgi:hypothetical protein
MDDFPNKMAKGARVSYVLQWGDDLPKGKKVGSKLFGTVVKVRSTGLDVKWDKLHIEPNLPRELLDPVALKLK